MLQMPSTKFSDAVEARNLRISSATMIRKAAAVVERRVGCGSLPDFTRRKDALIVRIQQQHSRMKGRLAAGAASFARVVVNDREIRFAASQPADSKPDGLRATRLAATEETTNSHPSAIHKFYDSSRRLDQKNE